MNDSIVLVEVNYGRNEQTKETKLSEYRTGRNNWFERTSVRRHRNFIKMNALAKDDPKFRYFRIRDSLINFIHE